MRDGFANLTRQERRKRHDRQPAIRLAELDALMERGHPETGDPLGLGGLGHLDRAMTIGVGLDHKQEPPRAFGRLSVPAARVVLHQRAHRAQIGAEAVEIHFHPGRNRHAHGLPPSRSGRFAASSEESTGTRWLAPLAGAPAPDKGR